MRASFRLIIAAVFLAVAPSGLAQTLAVWEFDLTPTIKSKNTLVYRDGSMVLETQYPDGTLMGGVRPGDRTPGRQAGREEV